MISAIFLPFSAILKSTNIPDFIQTCYFLTFLIRCFYAIGKNFIP